MALSLYEQAEKRYWYSVVHKFAERIDDGFGDVDKLTKIMLEESGGKDGFPILGYNAGEIEWPILRCRQLDAMESPNQSGVEG